MSPRLAQRQGAILIMTWENGSVDGLDIRDNRIDWQPGGDTAAIQTGDKLDARNVFLANNEIISNGTTFVNPLLTYRGEKNRYLFVDGDTEGANAIAEHRFALLPETHSSVGLASPRKEDEAHQARGWQLIASFPKSMLQSGGDPVLRGMLVNLKSAALQFGQMGLRTTIRSDADMTELSSDWLGGEVGMEFVHVPPLTDTDFSLKIISPLGQIVQEWKGYIGPATLGGALRSACGKPSYGRLTFEAVPATD
jgi:hypothetical protein